MISVNRNPNSISNISVFAMAPPKDEESRVLIELDTPPPSDLSVESEDPEEIDARVSLRADEPIDDPIEGFEDPVDMQGLEIGDLVWGKVKSHPWWPGHIYKESFASPLVRRTRRDGHVLVAFFGDSSYGWFEPSELIPLAPTFLEKSKQTVLKSFVRAVEESVDEACRRAALGLLCRCRNRYCFRRTRVPNYFQVDVGGFEPNGVYSKRQIKAARENFVPEGSLGFIKQLAVMPRGTEVKSLEWYQSLAVAQALRRARFEEFDETYAQAFGQQPVRPARDELGVPQQLESFAPRVAPLSGALKIAEDLKKPSTRHYNSASASFSSPFSKSKDKEKEKTKEKSLKKSLKKNDFELKRRDEGRPISASTAASSSPSIPDASCFSPPLQPPQRQPTVILTAAEPAASDFVLQKRESIDDVMPDSIVDEPEPKLQSSPAAIEPPALSGSAAKKDKKMKKREREEDAELTVDTAKKEKKLKKRDREGDAEHTVDAEKKEKKPKKRDREGDAEHTVEEAEESVAKRKMKQQQQEEPGQDSTASAPPKKQTAKSAAETARCEPSSSAAVHPRPVSPPDSDLASQLDRIDLSDVISDLKVLAAAPFYSAHRSVPPLVRRCVLRFRAMVYVKSLADSDLIETDAQEVQAAPATTVAKERQEKQQQQRDSDASSSKPTKVLKISDGPSSVRKRPPSDRQEEMSAKRLKKLTQLKSLTAEKKAGTAGQKTSEAPSRHNFQHDTTTTAAVTATAVGASSNADSMRRLEKEQQEPLLPAPPKKESPTLLIMKFPQRSTLPSIANLKARFARFGPLDVDSTRVFWKSHTCRVLFKYNPDALKAFQYVQNTDIFGQIRVEYSLRELEAPASELVPEPPRRSEPLTDGPVQFRPGNGHANSSAAQLRPSAQPQGRLKSILKKPGDEAGKENQRVKFRLSGADNTDGRSDSPPAAAASAGPSFIEVPPPKSTSFSLPLPSRPFELGQHLPLPPLPRQNPAPARPFEPNQHLPQPRQNPPPARPFGPNQHQLPPPPPPRAVETRGPAMQIREAQPQLQQNVGGGSDGRSENSSSNVDISHKLLSLLLRCNDIVSHLSSQPGYVPFRPL